MKFFKKLNRYNIFKNENKNKFLSVEMLDYKETNNINKVETTVKKSILLENICYKNKNFIFIKNCIFSALISSPLSGVYWYTTWHIIDENLILDFKINLALYTLGFLILALFYVLQNKLEKFYKYLENLQYCEKFANSIFRNCYNYLVCLAIVLEWYGLWNLFDVGLIDGRTKFSMSIICMTYLSLTRSTRALITTPYLLALDEKENCFEYVLKSVLIIYFYLYFI